MKKTKKKKIKDQSLFVKTTSDEKEYAEKMASKHFDGNISAMVRFMLKNFDFKYKATFE